MIIDFYIRYQKYFWMYRILIKGVDRIIVQTDKSKTWLNQNFPDSNVKVIPNPIVYPLPLCNERSVRPNSVILQNKKVILASGRMHDDKGFDILLRAFSQIKDKFPDWDLIILELKRFYKELRNIILKMGLDY